MTVTVVVDAKEVGSLCGSEPETERALGIKEAVAELGVSLKPLFADSQDNPLLSVYFTAVVSNRAEAERVVARLQPCPGVQAAYLKPAAKLAGVPMSS